MKFASACSGGFSMRIIGPVVVLLVAVAVFSHPAQCRIHPLDESAAKISALKVLFPEAGSFKEKSFFLSDAQATDLEGALNYTLSPQDRAPTIYSIAGSEGARARLAIFINPRRAPRIIGDEAIRLVVGISIFLDGEIDQVRLFDYKGNPALVSESFLGQFKGKSVYTRFKVGKNIVAVKGEEAESQLIADSPTEAAVFLHKVLAPAPRQ
jgi:hypothetical protein